MIMTDLLCPLDYMTLTSPALLCICQTSLALPYICWPKRLHSPFVLCFDDDKPNKCYLVLMIYLR